MKGFHLHLPQIPPASQTQRLGENSIQHIFFAKGLAAHLINILKQAK